MSKNKRMLLIVLLVVLIPLPFFIITSKSVFPRVENNRAVLLVTQIFDYGEKKPTDRAKIEVKQEETALDLLRSSSSVIIKGDGASAYVVGINGVVADDSKKEYWAFYVNGRLATIGAGSYKLIGGEQIEWKLENY